MYMRGLVGVNSEFRLGFLFCFNLKFDSFECQTNMYFQISGSPVKFFATLYQLKAKA